MTGGSGQAPVRPAGRSGAGLEEQGPLSMPLVSELAAGCGVVFYRPGSPNGAYGRCHYSAGNSSSFRNVNTRDTRALPIRASLTNTPSDGACLGLSFQGTW